MPDRFEQFPSDVPSGKGDTRNEEWMRRFRRVVPNCSQRSHDPAFGTVFERGQGSILWDVDGNSWIDLTCGYSACNFGHAYAPLVQAATQQLTRLTHLTGEPHVKHVELAERLVSVMSVPGVPSKVIFNTSGARAVESSLKAACSYRPGKVLCLAPGFHGRSISTAAISDTPQVALSHSMQTVVIRWPVTQYPYCCRCPLKLAFPGCTVKCADPLLQYIEDQQEQISCVIVEPALGARGYVFPPAEYFQQLRAITSRAGILMIADEIQTGLGRCGDWLLSRNQGWAPDLTVVGKSLGGGMAPLAAVIGREDVLNCIPAAAESETFAGNPLASALGLAVLDLLADQQLFERGRFLGQQLRATLCSAFREKGLGEYVLVEGQAASCVVEFRADQTDCRSDAIKAQEFAKACVKHRLRVHLSGPLKTRVVLLPALTMTGEELAQSSCLLLAAMNDFASG